MTVITIEANVFPEMSMLPLRKEIPAVIPHTAHIGLSRPYPPYQLLAHDRLLEEEVRYTKARTETRAMPSPKCNCSWNINDP